MIVFPFTKLMHAFTLFMARWYNGAIAGYKGVEFMMNDPSPTSAA